MANAAQHSTIGHVDEVGVLRVFAVQYRIDLAHTVSPDAYRDAMRALVQGHVVRNRRPGQPTLVVFPELIGLPTLAIGSRGTAFRDQAELTGPSGEIPIGLLTGMAALGAAYQTQSAAYQQRFGALDPTTALFVASTDSAVRTFLETFSDIARDFDVFVVAGSLLPDYRVSDKPAEVAMFGSAGADDAYIARSSRVSNCTLLWGPEDIRTDGAVADRNLLARNEKIPLTDMEVMLGIEPGPAAGQAARTNAGPIEIAGLRIGFATSLPAFAYGYEFGSRPPGFDPFAAMETRYAAAQDLLGVDVMIQADANPGPWASPVASGAWQPLEWMGSTWRAVADPTVSFRFNVTPMMTGNLLDLPFDGQSAITARGYDGPGQHYVGNTGIGPDDPPQYHRYAGPKPEFLALAPWVSPDASRTELTKTMAALLPGSGSSIENSYVQTALFADLTAGSG